MHHDNLNDKYEIIMGKDMIYMMMLFTNHLILVFVKWNINIYYD